MPEASKTKFAGWLKKAVIAVVIVGAFFGWKFYNKGSSSTEAREAIASWVQGTEIYAENKEYMDGLLDAFHENAFDKTYSLGNRRRSSKFDVDRYAEIMFTGMSAKAKNDGKLIVSQTIDKAYEAYKAVPEE